MHVKIVAIVNHNFIVNKYPPKIIGPIINDPIFINRCSIGFASKAATAHVEKIL